MVDIKDEKAEQTEEVNSGQDSPTDEAKQTEERSTEEESQSTEGESEADKQDRNWRALREENERLRREVEGRTEAQPKESPISDVKRSPAVDFYLGPEVQSRLAVDEMKAELQVPELESDPMFAEAVAGRYRREIDGYVTSLARGADQRTTPLPSVSNIAKKMREDWKKRFGSEVKKAESEGAKKAKISVEEKQATSEAEGRSDRANKVNSESELADLRRRSQEGDPDAIMARLAAMK